MLKMWPGEYPFRDWLVILMAVIGAVVALVICAIILGPNPLGPERIRDENALILGIGLGGGLLGASIGRLIRILIESRQ